MIMDAMLVILAEDEFLIRVSSAMFLADAGYEVLEAEHAAEALAHLDRVADDVSLLFTDVHMPGNEMNGLELAHHVAANWPGIGLLIASGDAHPTAEDLPAGSRFVSKPYEMTDVVGHMRALVPH